MFAFIGKANACAATGCAHKGLDILHGQNSEDIDLHKLSTDGAFVQR